MLVLASLIAEKQLHMQASQARSKRHHENTNLTGSLESARMHFLLPETFRKMAGQPDGCIRVELLLMFHLIVFTTCLMRLLGSPSRFMLSLNRTTIQLYWGLDW